MAGQRVVILGGGFGGLACARALDGSALDVLLLDAVNYHLFTPLLYQVATALLNPSDIAFPLRARFRRSRNVRFRQARVREVDLNGKVVRTETGGSIPYDWVVIATGSSNNYFGNPKLAEVALGMKTLPEAIRLRNHVLACLERATGTSDPDERRRWLTFVTVGGGPTGVEYAGALGELLDLVMGRDYPELEREQSRIVLIEGMDRVLPGYAPSLSRYADRQLRRRGVDVRVNTLMEGITDRGILITGGDEILSETIVWSAGVRPNHAVVDESVARSRTKRLRVDDRLRIEGHPEAFGIGDVASVDANGDELPMLSPPAMQEGRQVARLILRGSAPPFRYLDKGSLATIGRNAAVGQVGRFRFTGFIGWVVWLVVHIYYLIGFRNRLAVLLSWSWDYLRRDRPIRIVTQAREDDLVQG
jgi:NADH:ubiquinone reductase (H+-translocating)